MINEKLTFYYKNNMFEFNNKNRKELYTNIIDWLYTNNYNFKIKLYNKAEVDDLIKKTTYRKDHFYKIKDSDKYVLINAGFDQLLRTAKKMLNDFGISDINFEDDINSLKSDLVDDEDSKIKPFSRFNSFDIESELKRAQSQMDEDDVSPFNKFKASQSEEEKESFYGFTKNPFRQAICVLGGSGAGKSTTIENILAEEGHEFEFIIPSASTTGLLSQFSPSKSGYVPSKLGKMILNAYENPTQLFTAVFDECHKSNVIEMINDELLQAISTKRNNGKRFISLDDDTAELYPGTEKHRGNILIPDNLGFIFISSKPDVIIHNDDFFNRIDIVQLKSYEEERLKNIEHLLSKRLDNNSKKDLKSNNE